MEHLVITSTTQAEQQPHSLSLVLTDRDLNLGNESTFASEICSLIGGKKNV